MVVINLYNQLLIVYLTYCGHVILNKSGIEFVPLIALKESASIALKECYNYAAGTSFSPL